MENRQGYENIGQLTYADIDFIDEEVYSLINKAYSEINFFGDFKKGDEENYDYYKKQYLRLLNCEATFFDKQTQKEYYINEFKEMDYSASSMHLNYDGSYSDIYDPSNFVYYFFDMDDDGAPEICITNEIRFVYIVKYYPESDVFILWYEIPPSGIKLMGTRKLWSYSGTSPIEYTHFQLDQNGEIEYQMQFYVSEYYNAEKKSDDILYMVTLPEYKDSEKSVKLSEYMKSQALHNDVRDCFLFRVTEKQWAELSKSYFDAREMAQKNVQEVRFNYKEFQNLNLG